jgi:hypothetical protein
MTRELVNLKPLVTLAASVMPPGRVRIGMVRLAHELDDGQGSDVPPAALGTPLVGGVSATDG